MKNKLWLALLLAFILALSVGVVFAQGPGDQFCMARGSTTVEPGAPVRSLILFGCSGTVKGDAVVQQDAVVFGGSLVIEKGGRVLQDVVVLGGSVRIEGEIGKDVAIVGGAVELTDTAVVNGDVRVIGGSIRRSSGATVRGDVSRDSVPRIEFPPRPFISPFTRSFDNGFSLGRGLVGALAMAALGALLVVFFPVPMQRVTSVAQSAFLPSLGVGCLTLLAAPVLVILLIITLIGIPLAVLLVLAGVVAWYFGWIAIGYLAGDKILQALKLHEITPILAVIVGVLLIAFIGEVPCIGGLVSFLIGMLGLGAVILTRFGTQFYPPAPTFTAPLPAPPVAPSTPPTAPAALPDTPAAPPPAAPPATETGTD